MQRIVVLNPKGGSGKRPLPSIWRATTRSAGERPVLIDYDPQGSACALGAQASQAVRRRHIDLIAGL